MEIYYLEEILRDKNEDNSSSPPGDTVDEGRCEVSFGRGDLIYKKRVRF